MFFRLKAINPQTLYPALYNACLSGTFKYAEAKDRETKQSTFAIDINSADDLISLLSLAQVTDEYITGYYITGNTIEFTQKPYILGE